jgi:hypothetical protein
LSWSRNRPNIRLGQLGRIDLEGDPAMPAVTRGGLTAITQPRRWSARLDITSLVRAVAPGGRSIVLRRVGGNAPSTDVLAVPAAAVTPGDWTIEWRSIAPDGHLMRGEVTFRAEAARAR